MIAKAGAVAFNQFTFTSSWRVSYFIQRMDAAIGGTVSVYAEWYNTEAWTRWDRTHFVMARAGRRAIHALIGRRKRGYRPSPL
jgi:hypothetical protein